MTKRTTKRVSILVCMLTLSLGLQGCSGEIMQIVQQILPIVSQVMGSVGGMMSQSNANQSTVSPGQFQAVDTKGTVDKPTSLVIDDKQTSGNDSLVIDDGANVQAPADKGNTVAVDLDE